MLAKGKPDDAAFAYRPGQDPLPEAPLSGLTTRNGKVRLTFKDTEGTLVISTKGPWGWGALCPCRARTAALLTPDT